MAESPGHASVPAREGCLHGRGACTGQAPAREGCPHGRGACTGGVPAREGCAREAASTKLLPSSSKIIKSRPEWLHLGPAPRTRLSRTGASLPLRSRDDAPTSIAITTRLLPSSSKIITDAPIGRHRDPAPSKSPTFTYRRFAPKARLSLTSASPPSPTVTCQCSGCPHGSPGGPARESGGCLHASPGVRRAPAREPEGGGLHVSPAVPAPGGGLRGCLHGRPWHACMGLWGMPAREFGGCLHENPGVPARDPCFFPWVPARDSVRSCTGFWGSLRGRPARESGVPALDYGGCLRRTLGMPA